MHLTALICSTSSSSSSDLKSKYDEELSLREGAEQKLANLRQELQKERSAVEDLKTELVLTSARGVLLLASSQALVSLELSAAGLRSCRPALAVLLCPELTLCCHEVLLVLCLALASCR